MKRVGEDDVAQHAVRTVVRDVNCRVELEIARDVAGETDGR
jgi:hypothetical protein